MFSIAYTFEGSLWPYKQQHTQQ